LIVDLQRSQAEGLRLLARLRARPQLQRTPILFLSGSDDEALRFDALAAGADFYGVRPFGVLELQKALDDLVRNGRSTAADNPVRPPTRLHRLERFKRARRLSRTG
jgi:DNA-binding response OmpR family regulator